MGVSYCCSISDTQVMNLLDVLGEARHRYPFHFKSNFLPPRTNVPVGLGFLLSRLRLES